MAKIAFDEFKRERKEFDVQFPLYSYYDSSVGDCYAGTWTRITEDMRKVSVTRRCIDGDLEWDIECETFSAVAHGRELHLLGVGANSSDKKNFDMVLQDAIAFINKD